MPTGSGSVHHVADAPPAEALAEAHASETSTAVVASGSSTVAQAATVATSPGVSAGLRLLGCLDRGDVVEGCRSGVYQCLTACCCLA